VSVIPNAVDAARFTPDPLCRPEHPTVNVIVLSRLTYRKGIDLLVDVVPDVCAQCPNVNFIIGGDGPKRLLLEEMREKHRLHDRVEMLGAVPHAMVRDVLRRGHIFLNSSLTEAFCIAIVEAASTGLLVVSTDVGGVNEVLPPNMMRLAAPDVIHLSQALCEAVSEVKNVNPFYFHDEVSKMYSWHQIAERTETVYRKVLDLPCPSFLERLEKFYACGAFSGKLFTLVVVFDYVLWRFIEWFQPKDLIDRAPNFPLKLYQETNAKKQQ